VANEFIQRFEVLLAIALLTPAIALALLATLHKEITFWRYASAGMLFISFSTSLSAADNLKPSAELTLASHLLLVLGYYLCSKSVRQIYDFRKWPWLEEAGALFISIAFVLVIWNSNRYEYLATTLSLFIMCFTFFWGLLAVRSWRNEKSIGAAMIIIFSMMYGGVNALRAIAALQVNDLPLLLPSVDSIFIVSSLAATLIFALAQFMHGNNLIQRENAERLHEATIYLSRERELTSKLQEANKEQQNLQKLMMHEFKRPLSALHAALQADHSEPGSVRAKLDRLRVLTQQASTYLEGISQYQDVAELFDTPNWSLVYADEIANDIKTKWDVKVEIDNQLAGQKVLCDPLLLDIAVGNLIENAKKFSKTPTGVSVYLGHHDNKLRLEVKDDGPGIPTAEWEHIWQKFYKLGGETSNVMTGCGLGLYVVNQVAKVHNGQASVISKTPSVLRLEFPLTDKADADE
jgi:signal transduction histidine kinase